MESILTSIKKMLGIAEAYEQFDSDLIIHINSVLAILTQIGVGSSAGFSITDKNDLWADFVAADPKLDMIKTYVFYKVKLIFDPPLSSSAIDAMTRIISELEGRIFIVVDPVEET